MSQTTRCPSCNACFRVVADQLRISDGWVRCGACSQVFDATSSLEQAEAPVLLPDLNLDNLRGPVERVKPTPAPEVAWQPVAPSATAMPAVSERPAAGDAWALRTARLTQNSPPALPTRTSAPVSSEQPQPVTNAPELPNALGSTPPSNSEIVAPKAQEPQAPDTSVSEQPSALKSQEVVLAGYELPGPPLEEDDETGFLVSILPVAPEAEVVLAENPESVAMDRDNLDLTSFLVPFTQEADSSHADRKEPATAPLREPQELKLVAENSASARDAHMLEALPSEPDILPEVERQAGLAPALESELLPTFTSSSQGQKLQDTPESWGMASTGQDEPSDDEEEPSFVRHARRRAFWMGSRVRNRLWLAGLALMLVLAGQVALRHRDQLAAHFPQARGVLVSTCGVLGCVVEPMRDISAILVEGSSFNRAQGDQYSFLLTLRNRSEQEVRSPVIELTLTDVQDQPVVRRVLQAQDLNLPTVLQPQQEWSGEIPMTIATGTARIAGFRALAFYPD